MENLKINYDRSESVIYDKADYPAYVRKGYLSAFTDYSAESHWHDDIELIYVLSGQMCYHINGETVTIREGEGIFVNARQLHFGYSETRSECVFLCILLHPMLLCSSRTVEREYIDPILQNPHIPFCHLRGASAWEKEVLSDIVEIYAACGEKASEMKIQRAFLDIWIRLYENIVTLEKETAVHNQQLSVLKNMISYVNRNYRERMTLAEIAHAGNVGKTGCCAIFKRYLNKTPNEYVTQYRLRKAAELLDKTDMTVTEIGFSVGFSGASYFTETFRKIYGRTPRDYRKTRNKEKSV